MPELRPAISADISRLIEIRAAVRENRLERMTIGADDYLPYVEDSRCWVAEADGTIRGFAALDAETASIWALFVHPEAEGSGLGRALLDRLIAEARQRGLHLLTLETQAGTRAEHVYLQAGWQLIARDPNGTLHLRLSL
jgi:GNAT superfamily N-acetyltransferase